MRDRINVADAERWVYALGGAALAAYGLKRLRDDRAVAGAMLAAAGSGLICRSASGYCPVYDAAGIETAHDRDDTRVALGGRRGIHVKEAVTINKPAAELFRCWRRFDQLPRFMHHVAAVEVLDERRSRWTVKAPARRTVEWDAEIVNEVEGELIGWRTLAGADVVSAGSVRFRPGVDGRGTEVLVHLQYQPPAGRSGAVVAWLLGQEPSQTIREDLRRFKQLMEAGEFPTIHGQPRGN
jgi:uncharacterized membrane protein